MSSILLNYNNIIIICIYNKYHARHAPILVYYLTHYYCVSGEKTTTKITKFSITSNCFLNCEVLHSIELVCMYSLYYNNDIYLYSLWRDI